MCTVNAAIPVASTVSRPCFIIFAILCQDGTSGKTPLHYAVEQDNLPLAGFLILEVSFPCLIASE